MSCRCLSGGRAASPLTNPAPPFFPHADAMIFFGPGPEIINGRLVSVWGATETLLEGQAGGPPGLGPAGPRAASRERQVSRLLRVKSVFTSYRCQLPVTALT